jgi:lysine/ornithine N-monooxygenase
LSTEDVLIVGAGPFGLSISAHLSDRGVSHTLVGRPMDTWRRHMPPGMLLRSEPYGSDLASPRSGYDVRAYCSRRGLDYVHRLGPLSIERFLDYSDWYTRELVPPTLDAVVSGVRTAPGGFEVSFTDHEPMTARAVVLAVGLLPFKVLPETLAGLPADLVTHVSDHHDLTGFAGRRVAVVGGGQSALETLALLHEAGADARLVMRKPAINWLAPNPAELSALGRVKRPVNKLCEGWHCTFWNTPELFRMLPRDMRVDKARSVLGPAGAWWLKERVDGVVETITGHSVKAAAPRGSGVRLSLDGPRVDHLDVDHVIAGTGFRVDLARLELLGDDLRRSIDTLSGYPVLARSGESSVHGLYFAGAAAAVSLGPSVRFIAGTHNSAKRLARAVGRGRSPAPVPDPSTVARPEPV